MIITAILSFTTDAMGWSFPEQVALYLPIGFATMITVSYFTKEEDEAVINRFYSLLNTPVGQEHRLEEAGISAADFEIPNSEQRQKEKEIIKIPPLLDNKSALKTGEGLLLVDLFKLKETFSFKNYKVDLKGFGISWAIVSGYLVLAWVLSRVV